MMQPGKVQAAESGGLDIVSLGLDGLLDHTALSQKHGSAQGHVSGPCTMTENGYD